MKQFFKKIWNLLGSVKTADKHGQSMFWIMMLLALMLGIIGMSLVEGVILMYFIGVVWEVTYCYVPSRYKKIWGIVFKIPQYKEFFKSWKQNFLHPTEYHKMSAVDFHYLNCGVIFFIAIKLISIIFHIIDVLAK